jgi:pyruvate dehydrogenase complex dehydrogenase (E1) component
VLTVIQLNVCALLNSFCLCCSYRVYCLIGDGESAEGSVWEALHFGSHYKLDNLVAIIDINRLGQSEPTSLQHDIDVYQRRLEAFGYCVRCLLWLVLFHAAVLFNTIFLDKAWKFCVST